MNIAIIPARKGSKRLKNKNRKLLSNQPLIYYSIKFALINKFDKIIVSTNDEEIVEFSSKFPILIHKRRECNSGDKSLIIDLLKSIIIDFKLKINDNICLLQPTSPLRKKNLFSQALLKFNKNKGDSLVTISLLKKKIGLISNKSFIPQYITGSRSQELNDYYFENGDLYILKVNLILENKLFGSNINYFVTGDQFPSVDIDFDYDFEFCELILNRNKNQFKHLLE